MFDKANENLALFYARAREVISLQVNDAGKLADKTMLQQIAVLNWIHLHHLEGVQVNLREFET